jgi:hypothetical protein
VLCCTNYAKNFLIVSYRIQLDTQMDLENIRSDRNIGYLLQRVISHTKLKVL